MKNGMKNKKQSKAETLFDQLGEIIKRNELNIQTINDFVIKLNQLQQDIKI